MLEFLVAQILPLKSAAQIFLSILILEISVMHVYPIAGIVSGVFGILLNLFKKLSFIGSIVYKTIAMLTISMGTLVVRCALLIYGWMSTHMALVTWGLIVSVKISKIKIKYSTYISLTSKDS